MYRIGELSQQSGVTVKTIRYYEEIGLIPPVERSVNGYCGEIYRDIEIERLRFICSARALNIPLEDVEEILAFRDREEPPCRDIIPWSPAGFEGKG